MNFSDKEKKIIGDFYRYISIPKPEKELYLLKWKYGTTVLAKTDIIYESDNELDFNDPEYEDFICIVICIKKIINFNVSDGFKKEWFNEGQLLGINYHNFPEEIYNSKGELISKKEN